MSSAEAFASEYPSCSFFKGRTIRALQRSVKGVWQRIPQSPEDNDSGVGHLLWADSWTQSAQTLHKSKSIAVVSVFWVIMSYPGDWFWSALTIFQAMSLSSQLWLFRNTFIPTIFRDVLLFFERFGLIKSNLRWLSPFVSNGNSDQDSNIV